MQIRNQNTHEENLIEVAKMGHLELLKDLIAAKVDLNQQDREGDTALTWAIYKSNTPAAKLLIAAGANLELPANNTPLDYAIKRENIEIINILLDHSVHIKNPIELHRVILPKKRKDIDKFIAILLDAKAINTTDREKNTFLIRACMTNDIHLLKALCIINADLNKKGQDMQTALVRAARLGHVECLKHLIEAKASLDIQDKDEDTALTWAIYNRHVDCAKLLIEAGTHLELPCKTTPLDYAINRENVEIINMLLERKVIIKNPIKLYEILSSRIKLDIPKFISILRDVKAINNPCHNGSTLLMKAVEKDDRPLVKALCEAKALLDKQDRLGQTALIKASKNIDKSYIEILIEAKADLNIQDKDKETALICATKLGLIHSVKDLIAAKADLDKQDKEGDTALTWAIYNNHHECAKLLITANANVNIPENQTSLDYALDKRQLETIFLLLQKGGLTNNPKALFTFLKKQDSTNENIYISFFILCELQKILRKSKQSNKHILLNESECKEAESYFSTLPYPKESIKNARRQVGLAIDSATENFFPSAITELISQYDNPVYRFFTPKKESKPSDSKKNKMNPFSHHSGDKPSFCVLM